MGNFLKEIDERKCNLRELRQQIGRLRSEKNATDTKLDWFRGFDLEEAKKNVFQLTQQIDSLVSSLASADFERSRIADKLSDAIQRKSSPFLVWRWFTDKQKLIRETIRQLELKKDHAEKNYSALQRQRLALTSHIDNKSRQIEEYGTFDCKDFEAKLSDLSAAIADAQSKFQATESEIVTLERAISSHHSEWKSICVEIKKAEKRKSAARQFSQKLSGAENSYERAMIHQECEKKFGCSKPHLVAQKCSEKVSSLNRKRTKIERRIQDELRILTRPITKLVIDGNNVCYEGQSFIGLVAIRAMLEELVSRFEISAVFDSDIRGLLNTNDQNLARMLGDGVQTYVSPTRTKADEYIIRLVDGRKDTYILSNDRFIEFTDHEAVKNDRMIRFMIAGSRISSPEINLSADFKC